MKKKKNSGVIKDWQYYKALYEKAKESKKHGKKHHEAKQSGSSKKDTRTRKQVNHSRVRKLGKAIAYQSENRHKMTNSEWAFNEILKSIKKKYPKMDYEFQHLHFPNPSDKSKFFIIDFFIYGINVAVEVDGGYHNEANQASKDKWRTSVIESSGISVIRYTDKDVCFDADRVHVEVERIIKSHMEA